MRKDKLTRIDKDFDKWLQKMAVRRLVKGLDKKLVSRARITKAILRHQGRKSKMEEDIENAIFE